MYQNEENAVPLELLFDAAVETDEQDTTEEDFERSPSDDDGEEGDEIDGIIRDFDKFGSTPPRTRIHQRDKNFQASPRRRRRDVQVRTDKLLSRALHSGKKYFRRHLSNFMNHDYEEGMPRPSGIKCVAGKCKKRNNKKDMTLLRDSERDAKSDVDSPASVRKDNVTDSVLRMKVESSNRFLSLKCKLVKTAIQWRSSVPESGSRSRHDFHDRFVSLMKTGNTEKDKNCPRQISREEHLWQTELKDMIWLGIQAWRDDRTPTQQDKFLCEARQAVPQLLEEILNYKCEKKAVQFSTQSSDSGINLSADGGMSPIPCEGCLSLFCPSCMEHENMAFLEVENLLNRLEQAESLYPSSKSFGVQCPLYASEVFVGKIKAMCIWYNIMRHHRLKLLILGKQLISENHDLAYGSPTNGATTPEANREWEYFCNQPLVFLGKYYQDECSNHRNFRKFIENVLKVKGLRKAMLFLEVLYLKVLKKARTALEKPIHVEDEPEDIKELRRYGSWSEEYMAMNLPSFRREFLFICAIPMDVLHEFLRMRLETKLTKPSALSIRQLIKELKEGLKLAVLNKQRYVEYVTVALEGVDEEELEKHLAYVKPFDKTLQAVIELYLDYIKQWVVLTQHEKQQKMILDEEWKFASYVCPHIPNGDEKAGRIFCEIASTMLRGAIDDIEKSIQEIKATNACPSMRRSSAFNLCRELQSFITDSREKIMKGQNLTKTLMKHLEGLNLPPDQTYAVELLDLLKKPFAEISVVLLESVIPVCEELLLPYLNDVDNPPVQCRSREVLHYVYKFTAELQRESVKVVVSHEQVNNAIVFAQHWIGFVLKYCEKGRGCRPRWANYGLEYLMFIMSPKLTAHLKDEEFEELKSEVESCLSHLVNSSSLPTTPTGFTALARSCSPSPALNSPRVSIHEGHLLNRSESEDSPILSRKHGEQPALARQIRVMSAINKLEDHYTKKLREVELIGSVVATPSMNQERNHIKPRTVNFPWQRGIKIGQGRFGKVYTAVNTDTGELMAMKEIQLQPNDLRTIKQVGLELKIFEGIQHENLVRYYGAEVHREELLIFMELCTEGTLESLVAASENGLPEGHVRKYAKQLLSAIAVLHMNSIVHRDIKPANIFLTDEGNRLKLGDFGSAVKIKAHTTVPGELRGFVGTQAYMAPEVFMHSNTSGHGRAADVWSLGCVVIELMTGQRPWSEFDSNYQIMFKVGMGEIPQFPCSISDEGEDFLTRCLQHNPRQRLNSAQLMEHPFLKVDLDEDPCSYTVSCYLEEYLKLGIKR